MPQSRHRDRHLHPDVLTGFRRSCPFLTYVFEVRDVPVADPLDLL
ncbi:hypothetical protein [Amycolatopsis sp. cmx-4-68]